MKVLLGCYKHARVITCDITKNKIIKIVIFVSISTSVVIQISSLSCSNHIFPFALTSHDILCLKSHLLQSHKSERLKRVMSWCKITYTLHLQHNIRPKKRCIGVTWPTLKIPPYPRSFFLLCNFRKKLRNCHKNVFLFLPVFSMSLWIHTQGMCI